MKSIALKSIVATTLLASASVAFALPLPPNDTSLCQSAMQAGNLAECLQINATTSTYVTPHMGYMTYTIDDGVKQDPMCTILWDPQSAFPSASNPSIISTMSDDDVQFLAQAMGVGNHSSQLYVQTTQGDYGLVASGAMTIAQDPATKKFFILPAISSIAFAWPANPQMCNPQSAQGASQPHKLLFM